jgi:ATP-dependent DNA ligase
VSTQFIYTPETGIEEFTPCQRRYSTQFPNPLLIRKYPVTFMAFDIIKLGNEYVVDKPYWKRKTLLRELICKSSLNSYNTQKN